MQPNKQPFTLGRSICDECESCMGTEEGNIIYGEEYIKCVATKLQTKKIKVKEVR